MERRPSSPLRILALGCGVVAIVLVGIGAMGGAFWLFVPGEAAIAAPPTTTWTPPEGPDDPEPPSLPPSPEPPRTVRATIVEVEGALELAPGSPCSFAIERRDRPDGTYWCNAQVMCGGRLLFGGFFECELEPEPERHASGGDPDTTAIDGDAALQIDTRRGTVDVWDDDQGPNGEFRVRAEVDAIE